MKMMFEPSPKYFNKSDRIRYKKFSATSKGFCADWSFFLRTAFNR